MHFEAQLIEKFPEISDIDAKALSSFRDVLVEESAHQNLTRILDAVGFIEEHLTDVIKLKELDIRFPIMDFGSGGGIPGIPGAILLKGSQWILAESEVNKAEFLKKALLALNIDNASIFYGRGEKYLKEHKTPTIVSRAVGKVDKIYSLIKACSTWNKLILLKGPAWDTEWDEFNSVKGFKGKLSIKRKLEYLVGKENKVRVIVELSRN